MLFPLVIGLMLHAAEPNEAEKLFRQMETKLMNAKSLDCTYEAKLEGAKLKGNFKGAVTLTEGNKSRFEISGEGNGKMGKTTWISDGVKLATVDTDKPKQTKDVGKAHNDIIRASLARTGLLLPLFSVLLTEPPKDFKVEDAYKVSDFTLGKKEKVGDHEAQEVQYTLLHNGLKEPRTVKVWIDTKTNLPLKRVISTVPSSAAKNAGTITETYSKLTLDGKIDPKQFELPKE